MASPGAASGDDPPPANPRGDEIEVGFEVIENLAEGGFRAALTLGNRGSVPLGPTGWELCFNLSARLRPDSLPDSVTVRHVNGDFHRLAPTAAFAPLPPGGERRIELAGTGWVVRETDAPSGFYLVVDGEARAVAEVTVAPFVEPIQTRRGAGDRLEVPTPASRYAAASGLEPLAAERIVPILPTPLSWAHGDGSVRLDGAAAIHHAVGLQREAAHLAAALAPFLGATPGLVADGEGGAGAIQLVVGPVELPAGAGPPTEEAYRLRVDADRGIEIVGASPAGVFYGVQSLRALLPPLPGEAAGELVIGEIRVVDAPRFRYRGQHLDVSRSFHPPATVRKLIDLMAFYKLNRLHLHLSDDEGWRLEVAGLPELTAVGGRRGHTVDESDRLVPSFGSGPDPDRGHGSGHYTRDELVELLRYAAERHIGVIPEIDVPGHARAAIVSMEARRRRLLAEGRPQEAVEYLLRHPDDGSVYRSVQGWDDNVVDVCLPSTYRFLERVFDELVATYRLAGVPLEVVHVGGDEVPKGVWEGSPACRELRRIDPAIEGAADLADRFRRRVVALLAARGLRTAGWQEIALDAGGDPVPDLASLAVLPYAWNNVWGSGEEDVAYRLANAGYEVVLSWVTNLYLDLAYDNDPAEPGFDWGGFVSTREAWEVTPLDVYRSAEHDLMGRPIDPVSLADRERLDGDAVERVLGIQGQLWGENTRSRERLEYLAFPKLLGVAERAWAPRPSWAAIADTADRRQAREQAWNELAHRLGHRELPRLDHLAGGVAYRLPPPGAVVGDGVLYANVAYPGLEIRFTTDGSEPDRGSTLYRGPVAVDGPVRLRTFDTRGRGSRTSVVIRPAGAEQGAVQSQRDAG